VIDVYRLRIICDSWQKTDKRDAANLSIALWLASRDGEMKLQEAWQPGPAVGELRAVRVVEQANPSAEERDSPSALGLCR